MRELLETDLRRAGLQLANPKHAGERTLRIPLDNWIELGAILGDGVRTGVNTSTEAGVKIDIARTTAPGS